MSGLHIGLDLDNTLIDYDHVFGVVGVKVGLLPPAHFLRTKEEVKTFLRAGPGGDKDWMRLQGQVYGRYIDHARLSLGAAEFLKKFRKKGARISLVSHKTRYGHFDPDPVNLWDAALAWLEAKSFFTSTGFAIDRRDVHFLETQEAKIGRIAKIGCHVFVDDLPEILRHSCFPASVLGIWFTARRSVDGGGLPPHHTWEQIAATIYAYRWH